MNRENKMETINELLETELIPFRGAYKLNDIKEELQLLLQLVQLPKRTLDKLEEGDVVIYKNKLGNISALFINDFINMFQTNYIGADLIAIIPNKIVELIIEILKEGM